MSRNDVIRVLNTQVEQSIGIHTFKLLLVSCFHNLQAYTIPA